MSEPIASQTLNRAKKPMKASIKYMRKMGTNI